MAEYQDIYDIHRNLTGKTRMRGLKRADDEFILVIHMLIFDQQGRFLVQRRVDDKASWPGSRESVRNGCPRSPGTAGDPSG